MRFPGVLRRASCRGFGDHAGSVGEVESRRDLAGRQYVVASHVRTAESARAVWWVLAGTDDESSALSKLF